MTDTHEKFMELAETTLDLMCCNVPEAGDVREESIKDIARALSQAHQDGIREGKRHAAEIARAAEIPPSDNEEPGDDEWWTRCAANGQAIQIARDILSTITDEAE